MAGRIRAEDIEAVRERSDIVAVVSGYLQLKKAGRDNLTGLCPFHAEKTPSFSVSPSKQLFHCHGCGEGGTVFTFLQKLENLSFPEAVERLASAAGVTLRYEGQSQAERRTAGRRQATHRAIAEAARLYQGVLVREREGADAREYLASRGIGAESIERFSVGYAPGYPDYLLKRLSKSYSPELLVEAGLVSKDDRGNLRDRFRGRVMFPIHDLSGSAVGFGGRLLAGLHAPTNAAKYVNSPETPVYRKGSLLYNLHRAKADLARTGRAFLVEGYTDVIAMDRVGVSTAVATCGTALGEDHLRLLARFASSVVLAFDSDEAGARAAERAFPFFEQYPIELAVLVLPEGLDPADFVQSRGERAGEELALLAERATPLLEYMIVRRLVGADLSTPEGQTRAVKGVVEHVLARVKDPVLQEKYAVITADKVGRTSVSETAVLLELQRLTGAGRTSGGDDDRASRRVPPWQRVEREALKLLIQAPERCAQRSAELGPERFATPGYRSVFELIREAGKSGQRASPTALLTMAQDRARGEQLSKLLAALAVEPPQTLGDVTDAYVDQVFLRLEEFSLKRQADEIKRQLERLNPLKASSEYDELYERFVKLEGARRRVRAASEAVGSAP